MADRQHHHSIWITANAGSGKTTYLTRRVVTLLLQGVVPERICCITYTKAAASEMRARVLALLRELLLAEDAACRTMVEGLLEREATVADLTLARSLFGRVLDSTSGGVQLTTIHGFCQDILRRFPLEAQVAPHFSLLEDMAAEKLLQQARRRLLAHYSSGDAQLDAAFEVIGTRGSESGFDRYISHIVSNRGVWEKIWRAQQPTSLRARLFALHGLGEEVTQTSLIRQACVCVAAEEAEVIRTLLPQIMAHTNPDLQAKGTVLASWLECEAAEREALLPAMRSIFLTNAGTIRAHLLTKKDAPEGSALAELRPVMEAIAARFYALLQDEAALACAEESFAVALLARALLDTYHAAKQALHALDYDDLIAKTCELFSNPAMLGWVMSKLDHRIDHLLIDEAQDTSRAQWQLAEALVEELIAANEGVGSGDVPRSLLVVGDEKQSIYSFQGAAPRLFFENHGQFQAMLSGSYAPLQEMALTNSYRSAEAVLRVVDDIAAQPDIASALTAQGVPQPHALKRAEAAGRVQLYAPLVAPEKASQPALTIPMAYPEGQHSAQMLAEQVADTVASWIQSGRLLESEGRPVAAGDILILVHKRKPLVMPLIRALQRRKIPVAGIDRLMLAGHLAVLDLLAAMRFVLNPADDLALAHMLRSPIIGISDDDLRTLCVRRDGTLLQQLVGTPWHALVTDILGQRVLSPYDFLTRVLEVGGARARFAKHFGEEVHEVLDELKAQAAAMPSSMPPSLAYFHDWMSSSTREIKREQEKSGDCVRIMTVHGAKGLEAPIVLLPDTVNVPTTQHELVYQAQDAAGQLFPLLAISEEAKQAPGLVKAKDEKAAALLAEYYRLLYVALTRARDELHIWGGAGKTGKVNPKSWYALVEASLKRLEATAVDGTLSLLDVRASQPTQRDQGGSPSTLPLPDWARLTPAPARMVSTALSPSQLSSEVTVSAYAQSGEGDARARGVRIHRLLELVKPQNSEAEIARLLAVIAPDWDEKIRSNVVREVVALLRAESWIWEYPSHAEATICGTLNIGGQALAIGGQIDRLVETDDAIIVLDYKTGTHIPACAAEISENYRLQLKAYQALVAPLYPDKTIRTAIVWTAKPLLMWCDDVVAATAWPNQFVIQQPPLVA